jgi:hypothetical protein
MMMLHDIRRWSMVCKNNRYTFSDAIKLRGIQGQRGQVFASCLKFNWCWEIRLLRALRCNLTCSQKSTAAKRNIFWTEWFSRSVRPASSLELTLRDCYLWRCFKKTFIKTTARVEDDLTEIIWPTVSATAKQKHPAVSSSMFTTCHACLWAAGGHL